MASFLSMYARIPVAMDEADKVLQLPFVPPNSTLRSFLDEYLLARCGSNWEFFNIEHYPDETWFENHLHFLQEFTGWEVLALSSAMPPDFQTICWAEKGPPSAGPCGYFRSVHKSTYMAFVYADAALAHAISKMLTPGQSGIFEINGESNPLTLLLEGNSLRLIPHKRHYKQHPLIRWLHATPNPDHLSPTDWPAWNLAAQQLNQAESPFRMRWEKFVEQQRQLMILKATENAPVRLNESHFYNGKEVLFGDLRDQGEAVVLENCDPNTFCAHSDRSELSSYVTDAKNLWYRGQKLPCKYPQNVSALPYDHSFFTDGHYIYSDDETLPDVIASEVCAVRDDESRQGFLWRNNFYSCYGNWYCTTVDPTTFRAIGMQYFVDREGVYELHQGELYIIEDFEANTSRFLHHADHTYLIDNRHVSCIRTYGIAPKKLKAVKATAFHAIDMLPFVTDGNRVWLGHSLCKDLQGKLISVPRIHPECPRERDNGIFKELLIHNYFCYDTQIYYFDKETYNFDKKAVCYRPLVEVQFESFEILHTARWCDIGRDQAHVWVNGKIIEGAKASGFRWLNSAIGLWTDGDHYFCANFPTTREKAEEEVRMVLLQGDNDLTRLGGYYFLNDSPIPHWTCESHSPSVIDCIEDANNFYSWYLHSDRTILVWSKNYADEPVNRYDWSEENQSWILQKPAT
jgi:DKNYY family